MTIFDQLFYNSFNYYKNSAFKKKANSIAIYYISCVQLTLLLVLGVFFAEFFNQMHVLTMSASKAWTLFAMMGIILFIKNWIQYSGKKLMIMNARHNKKLTYGIVTLWAIPIVALFLALALLKVF